MSEYSKITLNQLDTEAIADYVVESKNLVYRDGEIDSSSNKAIDVDNVAGISSGLVAVAIDKDHRTTVDNALKLGGKDASEYVTTTTGAGIIKNQLEMKNTYGDELQNLKDEVYQLRNELVKSGMINNNGQYNGFIDPFRRKNYLNLQDKLGEADTLTVSGKDKIHVDDLNLFNSLDVNDFICLYNAENKTFDIKEIKAKTADNRVITLDSDMRDLVKNTSLDIYKSKGIIHNGIYKFANDAENQLSDEEYHTGLSDDTYNVIKRINTPSEGFGYSFRIPAAKQGYLTSFEICAKATGNPGALMCYVIDSRDLEKFVNPVAAEADYKEAVKNEAADGFKFFAKSQPYKLDSALGKRYIKFNFLQDDGTYPLMTMDDDKSTVRYIAIIETTSADQSNYVELVFLQHKNNNGEFGDLELNNTTYYYKQQPDNSSTLALSTDEAINKTDMYYQAVTRGLIENEPEAQKQGLYTVKYNFFNTKSDIKAAKARLMLRILREGQYSTVIADTGSKVFTGQPIDVTTDDKLNEVKTIDNLNLKTTIYNRLKTRQRETDISDTTKAIIGNNIVTVQGLNDSTITTNNPVLTRSGDKVYRCAYLVNLKARKVSFDNKGILTVGDYENFVMPLTEVYKDFCGSQQYSDRLIFETSLLGKDLTSKEYNDFELQIYWENKDISQYSEIKRAQMGGIKDLVLTFNQGF